MLTEQFFFFQVRSESGLNYSVFSRTVIHVFYVKSVALRITFNRFDYGNF